MPFLPHVDLVTDLQSVVAVGEEVEVLNNSRKRTEYADCLHALRVDLL